MKSDYHREYYQKHKAELSAYKKAWYEAHKEEQRAKRKAYSEAHKAEIRAYARAYQQAHKEEKREYARRRKQALKLEVFQHYSDEHPKCAHCPEDDLIVLSLDHINNDGAEERRRLGRLFGDNFYRWLRSKSYPEGYQVLCHNCNFRKYYNLK